MAVLLLPVPSCAAADFAQEMAGQMWCLYPREYQKPSVVGKIGQMIYAGLFVPADDIIAGGATLSDRTNQQAGKGALVSVIH